MVDVKRLLFTRRYSALSGSLTVGRIVRMHIFPEIDDAIAFLNRQQGDKDTQEIVRDAIRGSITPLNNNWDNPTLWVRVGSTK